MKHILYHQLLLCEGILSYVNTVMKALKKQILHFTAFSCILITTEGLILTLKNEFSSDCNNELYT